MLPRKFRSFRFSLTRNSAVSSMLNFLFRKRRVSSFQSSHEIYAIAWRHKILIFISWMVNVEKKGRLKSHLFLKNLHSFRVTPRFLVPMFLLLRTKAKEIGHVCIKTYFIKSGCFNKVLQVGTWLEQRHRHWWSIPLKFLNQKLLKAFQLSEASMNYGVRKNRVGK